MGRYTPVRRDEAQKIHRTDAEKIRAITLHTQLGNWVEVAKITGIQKETLYSWTKQPWYHELREAVLAEEDNETASRFGKMVRKAQEEVLERLENGDWLVLRDGTKIRKPVSARDASTIANSATDKRNLLLGKPTSRTEQISTKDRLSKLAEEFKKFAKAKQVEQLPSESNDA